MIMERAGVGASDQGNDDQQAEGNLDGHIKDNYVYENTIFSPKSDIVVYAKEADNNVFEVCARVCVRACPGGRADRKHANHRPLGVLRLFERRQADVPPLS